MKRHHALAKRARRIATVLICLCAYLGCTEQGARCVAAEQAEILRITVGEPTRLSNLAY